MITDQEILDRIKQVLVEEFELREEDLALDAALYDSLGLDSLDAVDLVVALEKNFGFKIVRATDEEKIRSMQVVEDIFRFVQEKMEGAVSKA